MTTYLRITDPNVMEIDTVAGFTSGNLEGIHRTSIIHVGGVYNAKPVTATQEEWAYAYPTMTFLTVTLRDDRKFSIELQQVVNQPAWNLGTEAALNAAIAAINAWL